MSGIVRFGVSLESDLLEEFDSLIGRLGYGSRSDAIRHLIRGWLVAKDCEKPGGDVIGVLGLVFDHEARELTETLTSIQHKHAKLIVSSSHIHLDAHNCLEVIILRGRSALVRKVSEELINTRNVKHGDLIMTTVGSKDG